MIEYRIGWSVNLHGAGGDGEWIEFEGDATTPEMAKEEIQRTGDGFSRGLEEALEAAGFDWWVETRDGDPLGDRPAPAPDHKDPSTGGAS